MEGPNHSVIKVVSIAFALIQALPALAQSAPAANSSQSQGCAEPAPLFAISDYNGPLNKLVASVARKVELKAVRTPVRPAASHICSLNAHEKFVLFVQNTIEPVTFIGVGFNAGLAQASDDDPQFGQGAAGYGKRFGAALADAASSEFFGTFLYPFIFRQDPRYYRARDAKKTQRLGHALAHVFVAQSDAGKPAFNYSEWFTTASSIALHNVYHPGAERGFGPAAGRFGIAIGSDVGFAVLREFWPEISRKFKLPFRQHDPNIP